MIRRAFNRLWVRFSAAIILIIFLINITPLLLLLIIDPQDVADAMRQALITRYTEAPIGLSEFQINYLADDLTYLVQQGAIDDIQFISNTTLVLSILAGILLGRSLSRPIERLVKATKAVGSRELNHQVEVKGAQELRELAENFNQMTTSLAQSEQLRRNLMADVSHELLTPLTVLQGNLRAILDDVYEMNKEEMGKLYEQNKHLIRLVRDLRQLGQAEAGQLDLNVTAVDINALARETATVFTPLTDEKGVVLDCELSEALPIVYCDMDRLRQVLHNLLANALRHTPPNGQITMRTETLVDDIRISVIDTGDGLTPELQAHIFDRYYRAEENRRRDSGGAGLGLAIAKALVLAHNGRIAASSPGLNQGSTFAVTLPILSLAQLDQS